MIYCSHNPNWKLEWTYLERPLFLLLYIKPTSSSQYYTCQNPTTEFIRSRLPWHMSNYRFSQHNLIKKWVKCGCLFMRTCQKICGFAITSCHYINAHTHTHHTFQHANRMKDVDKTCLLSVIRFCNVPVCCKCGCVTHLQQRKQTAINMLTVCW